ncbi:MAG: hypothetical protein KJ077_01330 [Anaerolineae bacterium]|nr:hypothetical protein [Anaerolineae bacterium]
MNQPAVALADLSAEQQMALRGHLDAARAVLFTKGRAPFHLAGLPMDEALALITGSLARTRVKQAQPWLSQLLTTRIILAEDRSDHE